MNFEEMVASVADIFLLKDFFMLLLFAGGKQLLKLLQHCANFRWGIIQDLTNNGSSTNGQIGSTWACTILFSLGLQTPNRIFMLDSSSSSSSCTLERPCSHNTNVSFGESISLQTTEEAMQPIFRLFWQRELPIILLPNWVISTNGLSPQKWCPTKI